MRNGSDLARGEAELEPVKLFPPVSCRGCWCRPSPLPKTCQAQASSPMGCYWNPTTHKSNTSPLLPLRLGGSNNLWCCDCTLIHINQNEPKFQNEQYNSLSLGAPDLGTYHRYLAIVFKVLMSTKTVTNYWIISIRNFCAWSENVSKKHVIRFFIFEAGKLKQKKKNKGKST